MRRFASFAEFYPHYLREHAQPACRRLHFVGTTLVLLCVIVNAASHPAPRAGRHLEVQSIDLPTGVELHV